MGIRGLGSVGFRGLGFRNFLRFRLGFWGLRPQSLWGEGFQGSRVQSRLFGAVYRIFVNLRVTVWS